MAAGETLAGTMGASGYLFGHGRASASQTPLLFTAVEQCGLTLEQAKGPLKLLVVEDAQPALQN